MSAVSEYIGNIKDAVTSIFEGMAVTASHFMRKPYTVQYPDRMPVRVQDTLPFRYRGILEVDLEICTGCLACERACPIDCIVIVVDKDPQTRQMLLSQFDIDIAKCMYCGLCSEPCPTGSIHHTTEFEGADYSLESLIRRFVKDPVMAYKPKKGPETDPQIAPILFRGLNYLSEYQVSGEPKPIDAPAVAITRTVLPPLDVEVVAGDKHSKIHPGSNTTKLEITNDESSAATLAVASNAAERERITDAPQASYPLLAQHMNVQGSVVLQAIIGADGIIQDLHVLSGPAILSSAAQQAVRAVAQFDVEIPPRSATLHIHISHAPAGRKVRHFRRDR